MLQGKVTATRWKNGFLVLLALCITSPPAVAAAGKLVIIKSSDNSYYNQTIRTLISQLQGLVTVSIIDAGNTRNNQPEALQNALVVALGKPAVDMAESLSGKTQQINAYLTLEQFSAMKPKIGHTLVLDQPPQRYLAFSRFLIDPERIGIMSDNDHQPYPDDEIVARNLTLTLQKYRVDRQNKLLPVLRKLLAQNDALLMLPQRALYNRDSLKGVLLTSYRYRKPVISYSPAHVKAGALGSIYSSPVDIGRHLADEVRQILVARNNLEPGFSFARYYSITTNRKVAQALGISLPERTELLRRIEEVTR